MDFECEYCTSLLMHLAMCSEDILTTGKRHQTVIIFIRLFLPTKPGPKYWEVMTDISQYITDLACIIIMKINK